MRLPPAHGGARRSLLTPALALALAIAGADGAAASSSRVRDSGYLRFLHSSGPDVIDEGHVRGSLPGDARVSFLYDGNPTVRASFVIWATGWSLRGYATCRLSDPNSAAPSFRGTLTLGGGTGRYAHTHGRGELFGVFYRHSYALEVQALGTLGV